MILNNGARNTLRVCRVVVELLGKSNKRTVGGEVIHLNFPSSTNACDGGYKQEFNEGKSASKCRLQVPINQRRSAE